MLRLSCILLSACAVLRAHDPGLSSAHLTRSAGAVTVRLALNNTDFAAVTGSDRDRDGRVDAAELGQQAVQLQMLFTREVLVATAAGNILAESVVLSLGDDRDVVAELVFPGAELAGVAARLELAFLRRLSHGHRCYVAMFDDAQRIVGDVLLAGRDPKVALPVDWSRAAAVTWSTRATTFFVLGVEHILIGFDHLAFLLALLVVTRRWGSAAKTITAFTAAHSLTLAGAALGVLRLPAFLVEMSIAASIVWVAIENLVRGNRVVPHRWWLVFVFGLVHGLGFANVLAGLGLGSTGLLTPLLAFNVGVEAGQLVFAATVLPLLLWAARSRRVRWAPAAVSIGVGLAGVFWLWERAVGA